MSQQTVNFGGTQVAEPPAPLLPEGDGGNGGDANRRNLLIVGAVVAVLVVALAAFFLLKGGGGTKSDGFVVAHHPAKPAAAAAQPPVVKLPKHVAAPVGRNPFSPLYQPPAAPPAPKTGTTSTTGGTTTVTSGGTTTTPVATYHPVWLALRSVGSSTATFDVGLSNGKTLKAVRYVGVKPLQSFRNFELLSIHHGLVTVKYGDGTPFELDKSHNTMVVD